MRVVLDANVIVSGIARYASGRTAPSLLLIAAFGDRYTLLVSGAVLAEVERALSKPYFGDRFNENYLRERLSQLRSASRYIELDRPVRGVATHWQDDLVLATALSGDADFLVTGDRELLELEHSFPFRIIHPNDFADLL